MLGNVYFCKNIKVRNFVEKIMETVAFLAKIQYWHLKWYLETLLMGLHSKVPSWVAADLTDKVRCIKPVVPSSWLYGIAHEIPWRCAKLQELKERAQSLILSASDCPGVLFQDQQKVKTQASEGVVPMLRIAIQELEAWSESAPHLREAGSKTSSELTTGMMRDYQSCPPEQHWRALEGAIAL